MALTQARARVPGAMTRLTRHLTRRRLRELTVGVAVVLVAVEIVLGRDYLWRSVRVLGHAEPLWIGLAVLASVASMGQFARTQRRMLRAAGTHVPIRSMLRLAFEANAINITLPGGTVFSIAYTASRLRGLGATAAGAGFSLLASGLLSSVTFWALALTYAGLAGGSGWTLLALAAALLVTALLLHRHPGAVRRLGGAGIGRMAARLDRRHGRAAAAMRRFAAELGAVRPRGRDWAAGTAFATLNWLTDLGCLVVCFVAVTHDLPSLLVVLAAYLAGMTASSVSVLPGGFGVIEVAMILTFTAGGVGADAAVPAVLLYRLVSCVLVVALGWGVWLAGRRRGRARPVEAVA
jgi:putative heme transporter